MFWLGSRFEVGLIAPLYAFGEGKVILGYRGVVLCLLFNAWVHVWAGFHGAFCAQVARPDIGIAVFLYRLL